MKESVSAAIAVALVVLLFLGLMVFSRTGVQELPSSRPQVKAPVSGTL